MSLFKKKINFKHLTSAAAGGGGDDDDLSYSISLRVRELLQDAESHGITKAAVDRYLQSSRFFLSFDLDDNDVITRKTTSATTAAARE
jgi:hypothetical protein